MGFSVEKILLFELIVRSESRCENNDFNIRSVQHI
jgi:hypothetical protein